MPADSPHRDVSNQCAVEFRAPGSGFAVGDLLVIEADDRPGAAYCVDGNQLTRVAQLLPGDHAIGQLWNALYQHLPGHTGDTAEREWGRDQGSIGQHGEQARAHTRHDPAAGVDEQGLVPAGLAGALPGQVDEFEVGPFAAWSRLGSGMNGGATVVYDRRCCALLPQRLGLMGHHADRARPRWLTSRDSTARQRC